MSEHRPFDKAKSQATPRRHEWVELPQGDLCVREMRVTEWMEIAARAQRPSVDPRGGVDPGEAVLWQVILSCFDGEGPEAMPLFRADVPEDIRAIYDMTKESFLLLLSAINRVNGRDATESELLRDFSRATRGA